MGISGYIIITFLAAVILLILGLIKKNRILKILSLVGFIISIGLFLLVWFALGYM